MAPKTSWHRYGTKLHHCHPVYSIAVWNKPRCYGNSHAIWDHIVLPATRQRCHSRQEDNSSRIILLRGSYYISPALNTHMTVHRGTVYSADIVWPILSTLPQSTLTCMQSLHLHRLPQASIAVKGGAKQPGHNTVTQKKYKIFHEVIHGLVW